MKKLLLFSLLALLALGVRSQSADKPGNWKLIASDEYPAEDVGVATYTVTTDFNADPTGVKNSLDAFQTALTKLGENRRGGVLFVPAGRYRISGKLFIPTGVTMRGEWKRPVKGKPVEVEQMTYISSLTDSSANAKKQITEIKKQADNIKKLGTPEYDDKIPLLLNLPRSYWEFANAYKPVEVASKLALPILILQGERDYQVTMQDFGLWRFGLMRNKNAFLKSYPKLNHMLQEGSGKATPFEYNQASPVVGYVMDDIASFIHNGNLL